MIFYRWRCLDVVVVLNFIEIIFFLGARKSRFDFQVLILFLDITELKAETTSINWNQRIVTRFSDFVSKLLKSCVGFEILQVTI